MLVLALEVLAAFGVIFAVAVVATGRGTPMASAAPDRPPFLLPAGRALTPDDLGAMRFSVVARGYRMDEVDAVLDRLREEIAAREQQLDDMLSGRTARGVDAPDAPGGRPRAGWSRGPGDGSPDEQWSEESPEHLPDDRRWLYERGMPGEAGAPDDDEGGPWPRPS